MIIALFNATKVDMKTHISALLDNPNTHLKLQSLDPLCLVLLHLSILCPAELFLLMVLPLHRLLLFISSKVLSLLHLLLYWLATSLNQMSLRSSTKLLLGCSFFLRTQYGLIDVLNLLNLNFHKVTLILIKCILHLL